MAYYKPPKVSDRIFGLAKAQLSKTGTVARITLLDDGRIFDIQDFPEQLKTGKFRVFLSEGGKKLDRIVPVDEILTVRFVEITHEEGKKPAAKTNIEYDYEYFFIVLEVTKGEFKGIKIFAMMHYYLCEAFDPSLKKAVLGLMDKNVVWRGSITHFGRLEHFLEVSGAWSKGPLPYPTDGNALPLLQKVINMAAQEFRISTNAKGNIEDFLYTESNAVAAWDDTLFDEVEPEEVPEFEDAPLKPDVEIEDGIEVELESGAIVNFDDDSIWEEE